MLLGRYYLHRRQSCVSSGIRYVSLHATVQFIHLCWQPTYFVHPSFLVSSIIAGYKLNGNLPEELGRLSRLYVLDLQHTELIGSLPEWTDLAGQASILESIRLDGNNLEGKIPEQWCNFGRNGLKDLILSNNKLTGSLPKCLSRLSGLEDFSVMHNAMTGTIPAEIFDNLLNLKTLHLAGNQFRQPIPASVCSLRDNQSLEEVSADCLNVLSPSYIQCACCTKCCDGDGSTDSCSLRSNLLGGDRGTR